METTNKERKQRYHVFLSPTLRRELRREAFDREVSISSLLQDAATIGLHVIRTGEPPKPAA